MIVIELDPSEIRDLMEDLSYADLKGKRVRVAVDEHTFKWKIASGMWSPPMGHLDPSCDYAVRLAEVERQRAVEAEL